MSETKTKWHKYPEETPSRKNTEYLVTLEDKYSPSGYRTTTMKWAVRTWHGCAPLAWAELPEPYKPD